MDFSRRGFLGSLLAAPIVLTAANLMPISTQGLRPKLWADGKHDDTEALQWRIDNAHSLPVDGTGKGLVLINSPLLVRDGSTIQNWNLLARGYCAFEIATGTKNVWLRSMHLNIDPPADFVAGIWFREEGTVGDHNLAEIRGLAQDFSAAAA